MELNASDTRNKNSLKETVAESLNNTSIKGFYSSMWVSFFFWQRGGGRLCKKNGFISTFINVTMIEHYCVLNTLLNPGVTERMT